MATKTRTRKSKTAATAAKAAAPEAATNGSGRKRLSADEHAERGNVINSRLANGETLSVIASDLGIRPNIAHGYVRQAQLEAGDTTRITFKNDADLVAKVVKERDNLTSRFNSWGWLSTRTGVSESRLKGLVEAAGYDVSGTNIATARKAAAPPKPAAKKASTTGTAKKTTALDKAKRTRTRKAASPS
jgi:hypothetical protein